MNTFSFWQVQGIMLQICNQLGKCSNALRIPMPHALCVGLDQDAPEDQEASPPAKVKIDKEEDTEPFPHNKFDNQSDEELSYSHSTKQSANNSSAEIRRKRERSESQLSSTSEQRNKKSKR